MTYKILISPEAIRDIEDAFEYYRNFSESTLILFANELQQVYDILELNPFFQIRYKKVRGVPFKSLPYLLLFELNKKNKMVYIYSVFNTHQNTNKYPER